VRFKVSLGIMVLIVEFFFCCKSEYIIAGGHLPILSYRGSGQGKVVFDHQVHASKGFLCVDCHTNFAGTGKILFTTQKQGLITFNDHTKDTKCFTCHNGNDTTANNRAIFYNYKGTFNDCNQCHRKFEGT